MSGKLEGLDKLNRRLDAVEDTRDMLRQIQLAAVAEAKRLVPRQTDNLARSISPGSLSSTAAIVQARAGYAAYVELGTKPHRIPKTGNARRPMPLGGARRLSGRLRTGAKPTGIRGGPPFAWNVKHPGTRPQPYLMPGARLALRQAGVRQIIEKWNRAA